jgi:hypothetical protein
VAIRNQGARPIIRPRCKCSYPTCPFPCTCLHLLLTHAGACTVGARVKRNEGANSQVYLSAGGGSGRVDAAKIDGSSGWRRWQHAHTSESKARQQWGKASERAALMSRMLRRWQ